MTEKDLMKDNIINNIFLEKKREEKYDWGKM